MTSLDVIDQDAVVVAPAPSATLFRTNDPWEVVTFASKTADALASVVKRQKLTASIQGRQHVLVEGWTLLGSMLGVFPICVWTRKLEDGWEARVEARTRDGAIVGAAEAMCTRAERTWSNRDEYALRSMAQTRATSKALRQPLGFVMVMSGFEATPAEEMPSEPAAREPLARPEGLASPAQVKNILRLILKLDASGDLPEELVREVMRKEFGTDDPAQLVKQTASDLITRLKAKAGEE